MDFKIGDIVVMKDNITSLTYEVTDINNFNIKVRNSNGYFISWWGKEYFELLSTREYKKDFDMLINSQE